MVARATNHDWLQTTVEAAIEPEMPIVDPHHHLWDFREGMVQQRYMGEEFGEDLSGGHNIVSSVFIECGAVFKAEGPEPLRCVGETEFVNGIAALSASGRYGSARIAAGIVGTADLRLGSRAAEVLDAQIAAGGGRFRGIRQGALWHAHETIPNHRTNPPEGLLLDDDFRAGFKHLGPRDLSFDVWCCHPQIPEVTDLARAFPEITIILDHFGGPLGVGPYAGKADDVFDDWVRKIDALATCPNVMAKLGGLNMAINGYGWERHPSPPSSAELMRASRRYFDHMLERFGLDRCMFESNFPVDKLSCSYTVLWNSFKRLTKGFPAHERAALFHDTAERVYRL